MLREAHALLRIDIVDELDGAAALAFEQAAAGPRALS